MPYLDSSISKGQDEDCCGHSCGRGSAPFQTQPKDGPFLRRNASVHVAPRTRGGPLQKKRSNSISGPDDVKAMGLSDPSPDLWGTNSTDVPSLGTTARPPPVATLLVGDEAMREFFGGKALGFRHRGGGPLSLLSGLFSCWNPVRCIKLSSSSGAKDISVMNRTAALLEASRQQQQELARKQDTLDLLEWQLEQMRVLSHKEQDLESVKKSISGSEREDGTMTIVDTKDSSYQTLASVLSLKMAMVGAHYSIRALCRVIMKQMEASGYSVLSTLLELEPGRAGKFLKKEHAAYALESRVNRAFFNFFENESFDESGVMRILDPSARCSAQRAGFHRLKLACVGDVVNSGHADFDPGFRRFCEKKTQELWSQLSPSFQITFDTSEERDVFTSAFLDAAKGVWLLHCLAFSTNPPAGIIRVAPGMDIDPLYVEVVPNVGPSSREGGDCPSCGKAKVEFMIMPGFRCCNDKIIRCQVYPHLHC